MRRYLKLLLQIFLAPKQGWEDVSADPTDPDDLARRGLYPLSAIAAATSFLALVYHTDVSPVAVIIRAIAQFGAYFAGYFIAVFALTSALSRVTVASAEPSHHTVRQFAVCMMGLMAATGMLRNCLPSDFAIVNFLYVYLAIIMWRGERFLHIAPGKSVVYVILAVVSVIVPPLLIMML